MFVLQDPEMNLGLHPVGPVPALVASAFDLASLCRCSSNKVPIDWAVQRVTDSEL
jgi:hypothetical protein